MQKDVWYLIQAILLGPSCKLSSSQILSDEQENTSKSRTFWPKIKKIGLNLTINKLRSKIQWAEKIKIATPRFSLRRCISHVLFRQRRFFSFLDRLCFKTFPNVTFEHRQGRNVDHNALHLKEMSKKSDVLESDVLFGGPWGCSSTN